MRNCFIYGGFNELKSIITSGNFTYNNRFFDVSKVMFIGEIDTNDLEECFNISIADEATENIKTVKDLVEYIEKSQK